MKKNWVILSKNLMFLIISLSILFVFSSKAYATAADIFTTKSNVTLPNSSMSDIAYGNGVYIAVGAYGAIIKSTDADTWVNVKTKANISSYTGVGTPGSFAFYGVAYGNGVFVVGGSEGVILSSTDGITWTQRTSNITSSIGDIDYLTFNGSSAFYAMSQGKFIKSTDGITWTTVTPTGIGSTDYLTRVTVGNSGTRLAVGSSPGKIYYTINGTTWVVAQPTTPAYASGVNMLRWMNDRYFISDPSAYIWTSTDLSSFTLVGSPFKQTSSDYLNQMFTGFYDGSKYYMFGGQSPYGYGAVYTSTNATTWIMQTFSNSFVCSNSVFVNGKYFRLGNEGMLVSNDGTTWNYKWGGLFSDISYDGTKFVAVGKQGGDGAIWTSTDQQNWTNVSPVGWSKPYRAVAYGNSNYVAVGELNGTISTMATSNNGTTWTRQTGINDSSELYDIAYGSGKFVVVGAIGNVPNSTATLKYSSNGVSWTSATLPATNVSLSSITFTNNKFIALGYDNSSSAIIWTSNDGVTWTDLSASYSTSTDVLSNIIYDGNKYILLGYDTSTYELFSCSSADFSTWSSHTILGGSYSTYSYSTQIARKGSNIYILATDADLAMKIFYSNDQGQTWQDTAISTSSIFPYEVMEINNEVVISGDGQLFMTTASASNACDVTTWTTPSSPTVTGTTVTKSVGNGTSSIVVDVTVSANASWKLYSDAGCTTEIADKTMSLSVGGNTTYVKVTAEDGSTTKVYTLTATRAAAASNACDVTTWTTPISPTVTGTTVTKSVGNGTSSIVVDVTVSENASWKLYSDAGCTTEITNKTMSLGVGGNTAYVKVTAEDGSTTKVYTLTATRGAAVSNACDVTTWTIPSSPTVTGITVTKSVGNGTSSIVVDVTVSENASWKLYSDAGCTTEITNKTMSLGVGGNTAYVKVTAEDGSTTKVYTLTVTRGAAASNACDVTTWTTPSSPTVTGTTVTKSVGNGTSSIVVDVTVSENASWKLYSDAGCTTEITNKTMSLGVGGNTAYVKVTAEDGSTTKVYTLTATRAAAASNACDVTTWTTPISPTVTGTTVTKSVGNGTSSIVVDVTVSENASWKLYSDAGCTTEITNKTMSLGVGGNTAYVKVTAEDGSTTKVYTLTATRGAAVSNACDVTTWTIPSSPTVTGITVTKSVGNGTSSIVVDVTVSENASWKLYSDAGCTTEITNKTMSLGVGGNTTYVKVTAEDGSTTKVYALTVTRDAAVSNSSACDITAWTTTTPGSITITETTVTKGVGNGASSIVVDVTVSENASWKLYSDAGCTTEITNKTMILGVGGNTAYVRVTAEDGITTKVYTLTVIRDAAVINSTACNITAWTTTTPGSITITETTVTKSVGNGTSSILVDVIVSENASWKLYSDASCTNEIIDKTMSLSVGGNTAYVKVTAQDGSITKVYILTLIREAASSQSNGGSSRPSSVTNVDISTPNTVTGTVVDEKTGETVKGVTAQVTTQTDGTKTVSVKSEEAVVFKQPDGTKNAITDFSKLSFSSVVTNSTDPTGSVTNAYVTIKSDGTIAVSNLAKGTETKFEVTFDLGNGQKITIGSMNVKVSNDGSVSLTSTLIDPYGIITDAATGKIIAGVNVVLYYANTARNIANGKTPDTIVPLPTIDGFKPNNNVNPQISDANGAYGWMVFPTSDYYIVATKAGFYQYTSFTISVEQRIVKWDFRMNEKNADTSIDGVSRLAGQNRIDTSINLAKATYPGKLSNVIFATAGNFADALAGSVLAYRLSSPILLVGSSDLDQQKLLDYIKTNMDTTGMVYILGGNGVVSKQFEDKVTESGFANITRLGGADRYETSVKIAETLKVDSTTPVILASGESYPDALSISSIAAVNGYPILLVKKDEISDAVKLELAKIAPEKVFIIGLQGAVGTVVENQIPSIVGINENIVSRIGGQDRFETSLAIANGFKLDGNNICIATGNDFPDALAGSLYATKHNSPIMLVDKLLTDDAIKYVTERKTTGVMIFGGESVVNQAIQEQLTKIVSN